MKLAELNGHFTKCTEAEHYRHVEALAEADGVWFLCPLCIAKDPPGPEGTHMVCVGFKDRCPPGSYTHNTEGQDTRWAVDPSSTGLDNLTLTPSIALQSGCMWHGWVTNGAAQ